MKKKRKSPGEGTSGTRTKGRRYHKEQACQYRVKLCDLVPCSLCPRKDKK